jgi:hypothetical protein
VDESNDALRGLDVFHDHRPRWEFDVQGLLQQGTFFSRCRHVLEYRKDGKKRLLLQRIHTAIRPCQRQNTPALEARSELISPSDKALCGEL